MKEDMTDLTKIGSLIVPDNMAGFDVRKFFQNGAPGIKSVGPKLAQEVKGYSLCTGALGGTISLYRASAEETGDIPYALRDKNYPLNWWQLYWLLQWPGEELLKALQYKDQIGTFVQHNGNRRAVRIKLGWNEGHAIGGRPIEPNWAWNEGTIFAVREPVTQ